ncbi:unnamed protein product [Blepharisma stoltei]|uniref:DNA mismatch repair protein S5 domain-containing protein n=1 Tax=Blepharisma stoltei TaxID=1481888 RepID=A0AAU9IT23_9CILI|nr:unnamed protein product [Blepharisma stoltei]
MAVIRELDIETVNKIAAGEVVKRPSCALKELIENSLDAQSTLIQIKLIEGGMTLLQITDNGIGIHQADYPLLCKRFATSKIQSYDDLSSLTTFGFRGEALSSISQVSKVTVCSRKQGEPLGYKGIFLNGNLIEAPEPFALDKGTLIKSENMFSNMHERLRALGNHVEEYKSCLDIAQKYSLHYNNVGFKVLKLDSLEYSTSGREDKTEIITKILKPDENSLAAQILEIPPTQNEICSFQGLISSNDYSWKQSYFVLFINNRLVDCKELKSMIIGIYTSYCPRSSNYFVYLSLKILPSEIDVNVHPTKREVRFSHQNIIFTEIQNKIQEILKSNSTSKSFNIRNLTNIQAKGPVPSQQVRENSRDQKIEWLLVNKINAPSKVSEENLTSIEELKEEIKIGREQEIFNDFSYVGAIDRNRILIQHGTSLYVCFAPVILEAMAYQFILDKFAQLSHYEIQNSDLEINDLIRLALESPNIGYDQNKHPPIEQFCNSASKLLNEKSELLDEYFSISIKDNKLVKIPVLIEGQIQPDINNLPEFLLRLAANIDWMHEKQCLNGISELIAWFYSRVPEEWNDGEIAKPYSHFYKNFLFPYINGRLRADARYIAEGKAFIPLVSTEELYKLFERC